MEETYVSNADVPHGFLCDKIFPYEVLERIFDSKEYLNARCYVLVVHDLLYSKEIYDKYHGKLAVHDLHYIKEICDEYYGKRANKCEAYYFLGKALWSLSLEEMFDSEREKNKVEEDKKELSESTDSPLSLYNEGSTNTKLKVEATEFMKVAEVSPQEVYLDSFHSVYGYCVAEESKMEEGIIISKRQLSDYHRELAWKFLEDAKLIYERQGTVEAELKVADILLMITGIHNANANYSSAIKKFKRYVKMYGKYLKSDEEFYADIYRMMGVLHSKAQMYPEALRYLEKSKQMYEMECENLNTIVNADRIPKCEIEEDISYFHVRLMDIQRDIELAEQLINKKKEVMET